MSVSVVALRDEEKLPWDEIGLRIGRDERTARRWYRKEKLNLKRPVAVEDAERAAIERVALRGGSR